VFIVIPVAASNFGTPLAVAPLSGLIYGTGSPISSSGPSDQQLSLYFSSPTSSQAYYPIGISSVGLYSKGQAYTIETGSVAGIAMINAFGTAAQSDGASLQLNAVIVIDNLNGTQSTLWSQDTVNFAGSQVYYESWIMQDTGPGVTFSESGASYLLTLQNAYYVYSTYQTNYALPFDQLLVMNVSVVPGGVQVSFTEESITGLTASNNTTLNYEYYRAAPYSTVFVGDPEASAAYFLISGQSVISYPDNSVNFYDAELVFGGPGNGSTGVFTSMGAQLYLFYSYSEAYYYFPTYFNYGFSTAESASGIQSALNSGMANVTLGTFQAQGPV
jgi:thermopsin